MKEPFAECKTIKVNDHYQLNKHEILLKLTCFSNTSVARESLNSSALHIANKIPRPQHNSKMFLRNKLHKRLSTEDCFIPQGFSRILKASSTVIKHNKLQ